MLSSEKIRFYCACGKRISVPSGSEGRKARCPVCQTVVYVPGGPKDESSIVTPASPVFGKLIVAEFDFLEAIGLRSFLVRKGFDVRSATEGLGLKMLVQEDPPDTILVSCDLPNMDTTEDWEKLKAVKRAPKGPPIVVALQGVDDDPPPTDVDAVVQKPVEHRELLGTVERLLLAREEGRHA